MPTYLIGLFVLFIFHCELIHAGSMPPLSTLTRFSHLSSADGLSHTSVMSITQDSKGKLWIGTVMGLNRYDGYEFTRFYNQYDDPNSLTDNGVVSMLLDSNDRLWIGTMKGLCRWRPSRSNFERIYDNEDDSLSLYNTQIDAMIEDETGLIWVGTTKGLYTIDVRDLHPETDISPDEYPARIQLVSTLDGERQPFPRIPVSSLIIDHDGIMWIGTDQHGLYWLDREAGRHEAHVPAILNDTENSPPVIVALAVDHDNQLWLGSWNDGVFTLSKDRRILTYQKQIPIQVGRSLHIDSYQRLWIGSWGDGLYKLNLQNGDLIEFRRDPSRPSALKSNLISDIFEDHSGNLWFGTISAGIHRLSRQANQFIHYQSILHDETSLTSNQVTSLHEDAQGNLWVGAYGGGLSQRNPNLTTFTRHPLRHRDLPVNVIWSIQECEDGNFWLGTDRLSILRYNPTTREIIDIPSMIEDLYDPVGNNSIRAMLLDDQERLWAGLQSVLYRFDLETESSREYDIGAVAQNTTARIKTLYQDAEGWIWIGMDHDGVFRLNPETDELENYRYHTDRPNSISGNSINSILQDAKGNLWIGTYDGLNRFIPETKEFERVIPPSGFPSNSIISILDDHYGRLWISSHRGIFMYDPETGVVDEYYESDGLQENIFFLNSAKAGKDGTLYFGGPNGFNAFHPDRLIRNPHSPNLAITSIQVQGALLETEIPYDEITQVTLSHNQSFLSIYFAALDYTNPAKNSYRYWLQGVHNDWIGSTFENRIHFSHLSPGEYILRVQGSNNDGILSEERQLTIRITPPFWKSTWFIVGTTLLLIIGILAWIRLRTYYITMRNRELEARVARRTSALQKANLQLQEEMMKRLEIEEHLRQNQKMEAVGRLAGGIAHDFNNLLTVVNGYSNQLVRQMQDQPGVLKRLEAIHMAGKRAAELTQQLLAFSRKQVIRLKSINLHDVLEDMEPLLTQLTEEKVGLSIHSDDSLPPIKADPTQLQQLLMNLVLNAKDASLHGGIIHIQTEKVELIGDEPLRLKPSAGAYVRLSVTDTGCGMSEEVLNHIFEPFYTTKEQGKGTGLGLSTVYGIVQQMNGGITVKSEEGNGARFEVYFPLAEAMPTLQSTSDSNADASFDSHTSNHETILLVEDEEAIRHLARHNLQEVGYTVIDAENGYDALQIMEERGGNVDLLLTDVSMPKMNGIQLAEKVATLHPETPIVLMSGYVDTENLSGSSIGVKYHFLAKPFQHKDLINTVRASLAEKKPIAAG